MPKSATDMTTAAATTLTRDEILDVVRQSGLVDDERLIREFNLAGEEAEPAALCDQLAQAGLITPWHSQRLLEGKWKGFFLGKYKILQPLGSGAMGSVFLAEHKVMRHRVAIKVLARRLVAKPNNVIRFEREARAAAAINHPNVVRAYDIDRDGDTHYLVMEYVQGETLQRVVQVNGPLDPKLAAEYVRQIALGLHEAHNCGLVHRDVKPANVLLDPTGVIKVLDLGLARMEDESIPSVTLMNNSRLIGTVDYLAPEQALNSHAIDGRADIYSLGCTLYYLLTGSAPFPSGSLTERILKHQTRRPVDLRTRRPGTPDELVNICSRMMEKLPGNRFATAEAAAHSLSEFLDGSYEQVDLAGDDNGSERRLLAEDSDPGLGMRSSGGKSSPASSSPDLSSPGRSAPGRSAPGRSAPGRSAPGRSTPGHALPSHTSPGHTSAGRSAAGGSIPARSTAKFKSSDDFELTLVPDEPETKPSRPSTPEIAARTTPAKKQPAPGNSAPKRDVSIFDELAPIGAAFPTGSNSNVLDGPLPQSDTLVGPSSGGTLGGSQLGGSQRGVSSPTLALLQKARAESQEQHEGSGINYPLWFLVIAGLILGFILVGVGFSYMSSFEQKNEIKTQNREQH